MANPRFYWYPNGAGLKTIDLEPGYGALPDLCEEDDEVFGGVAHSASGRSYSVVRARPARLTLSLPTVRADSDVAEDLHNLRDFAKRGGAFGFALDSAKAVFCYGNLPWTVGLTSLSTPGRVWYEPTATLAAGDEIALETPNPARITERRSIGGIGYTGGVSVPIDRAVTTTQPVKGWLRWKWYYPRLKLTEPNSWQIDAIDNGFFHRHTIEATIQIADLLDGASWAGAITTATVTRKTPDDLMKLPKTPFATTSGGTRKSFLSPLS